MSGDPVTVVVRYQALPGQEKVAKRELVEVAAIVAANEPACLGIQICQGVSDSTQFLLYERWSDRATYLGQHMQTSHLQRFIERASAFFAGPPEITLWDEVGEADHPEKRQ